jgi:hypothetical protein
MKGETQREARKCNRTQWTLDSRKGPASMTARHGSTPAAWTAVTLVLVGFLVGAAGLILSNWLVFWIGVGLAIAGVVAGKVMQVAGLGEG